jgi:spore coat polysaccharide biosynthesis protein SpsF
VAIVQARMGSERLPGKVLVSLAGRSVLEHVVRRLRGARELDAVAIATSVESCDDEIVDESDRLGIRCHRGPEKDVLRRFALAAESEHADVVVRITADCPLISAKVVDDTVNVMRLSNAAYASNTLERTYPIGLDVECFTIDALEAADREALKSVEREHVTPFIYNREEVFRVASAKSAFNDRGHSAVRLTLDLCEDLAFFRGLEECFPDAFDPSTSWIDIVSAIQESETLRELQTRACLAAFDPDTDPSLK